MSAGERVTRDWFENAMEIHQVVSMRWVFPNGKLAFGEWSGWLSDAVVVKR